MTKVKQEHYIDNMRVQLVHSYAGIKFYMTRYSDTLYVTDKNDEVLARVDMAANHSVLSLLLHDHLGTRKGAAWTD